MPPCRRDRYPPDIEQRAPRFRPTTSRRRLPMEVEPWMVIVSRGAARSPSRRWSQLPRPRTPTSRAPTRSRTSGSRSRRCSSIAVNSALVKWIRFSAKCAPTRAVPTTASSKASSTRTSTTRIRSTKRIHSSITFWAYNATNFSRTFDRGLTQLGPNDAAPNRAIKLFTGGNGLTGVYDTLYARAQGAVRDRGLVWSYRNDTGDNARKGRAYYWLGEAAHLLQDITLPCHALDDPHPVTVDQDPTHDWVDGRRFSTGFLGRCRFQRQHGASLGTLGLSSDAACGRPPGRRGAARVRRHPITAAAAEHDARHRVDGVGAERRAGAESGAVSPVPRNRRARRQFRQSRPQRAAGCRRPARECWLQPMDDGRTRHGGRHRGAARDEGDRRVAALLLWSGGRHATRGRVPEPVAARGQTGHRARRQHHTTRHRRRLDERRRSGWLSLRPRSVPAVLRVERDRHPRSWTAGRDVPRARTGSLSRARLRRERRRTHRRRRRLFQRRGPGRSAGGRFRGEHDRERCAARVAVRRAVRIGRGARASRARTSRVRTWM